MLRNEIKDRAQKLTNILKNETKAKHIPTAMQKPVAEFLEIFDMDTAETERRIERYLKISIMALSKIESVDFL